MIKETLTISVSGGDKTWRSDMGDLLQAFFATHRIAASIQSVPYQVPQDSSVMGLNADTLSKGVQVLIVDYRE